MAKLLVGMAVLGGGLAVWRSWAGIEGWMRHRRDRAEAERLLEEAWARAGDAA